MLQGASHCNYISFGLHVIFNRRRFLCGPKFGSHGPAPEPVHLSVNPATVPPFLLLWWFTEGFSVSLSMKLQQLSLFLDGYAFQLSAYIGAAKGKCALMMPRSSGRLHASPCMWPEGRELAISLLMLFLLSLEVICHPNRR